MIPDFTIENGVLKSARKTLDCAIVPEGVTEIGESAFEGCECLISVTLPDSVKTIGKNAFYVCSGLAELTLPEGLETIGRGAVIGFCLDKKVMLTSKPFEHKETSDYARFEHCKDYTWRLLKR